MKLAGRISRLFARWTTTHHLPFSWRSPPSLTNLRQSKTWASSMSTLLSSRTTMNSRERLICTEIQATATEYKRRAKSSAKVIRKCLMCKDSLHSLSRLRTPTGWRFKSLICSLRPKKMKSWISLPRQQTLCQISSLKSLTVTTLNSRWHIRGDLNTRGSS